MWKNNSIKWHGKGEKISHLQASLWIKYVNKNIEMFHEYKPNNSHINWNLLWHHVLIIKDENEHSHILYHWYDKNLTLFCCIYFEFYVDKSNFLINNYLTWKYF
jgi:hypothetical protein